MDCQPKESPAAPEPLTVSDKQESVVPGKNASSVAFLLVRKHCETALMQQHQRFAVFA
jgi:hypothetical protein